MASPSGKRSLNYTCADPASLKVAHIKEHLPERESVCHITCEMQVKIWYHGIMPKKKASAKRRSGCPLNASVEMLGDRWSLLIIRDMMLLGSRTFKEFLASYEGIATNILADRLRKLEAHGIITTERDRSDGRKLIYLLTAKGIDLASVLTEMVLWAAGHEDTGNQALVRLIQKDKEQFLTAVRQRWAEKNIRSAAN
jgi:DNA-binding HxlR family transcriptional regulator